MFPTNIPIDVSSRGGTSLGVSAVRMEDNRPHTQTHVSSALDWLDLEVTHQHLTLADYDTVVTYLRNNAGLEFDLQDPAKGRTYTGTMVSDGVREELTGGGLWTLTWSFAGNRTI